MAQSSTQVDYRALVDSLGQGVVLFDQAGHAILDNLAARSILGTNLMLLRSEGWPAMVMLLDGPRSGETSVEDLRTQSMRSPTPIRFHTYFAGAYTPCWISTVHGSEGVTYTMIVIDRPDWLALTELMATFRSEARISISSTHGHAELIKQIIEQQETDPAVQALGKRIQGFTTIIGTHMMRLQRLMDALQRLEIIRTGMLVKRVREARVKVQLADLLEDFIEEMADEAMADPELGKADFRDRLVIDVADDIVVLASKEHLTYALHDVIRNAGVYSPPDSLITITARSDRTRNSVQIDIHDQGYGIREKEQDRVFEAFQRARQPQIIGVDGNGLSLHLVKAELEAMHGRIWFDSQEGVGTTFSLKLPIQSTGDTLY